MNGLVEGCRVVITRQPSRYRNQDPMVNVTGTVVRLSGSHVGVKLDDRSNAASKYGCYWFETSHISQNKEEKKMAKLEGFSQVALVRFDCSNKRYAFALYETEWKKLEHVTVKAGVVVDTHAGTCRQLAALEDVVPLDEYLAQGGMYPTAEVIDIVDDAAYAARVEARERARVLREKRKRVEKELKLKIEKLKDEQFYREMAEKYKEVDPSLGALLQELDSLKSEEQGGTNVCASMN